MSHSPTGLPTKDWCLSENAEELADRIRAFWSRRGYTVDVRTASIRELGDNHFQGAACVRSNMVGGLPSRDPEAPVIWNPEKRERAYNPHPLVRA